MKNRMYTLLLLIIALCTSLGLIPSVSADQCLPERLDWMLEDEQCGDLVFADVIEFMHTCEDVQLRVRAANGLGQYRGREVFSALYRVLETDRSPVVRAAALNALDSIMQRTALQPDREIMEAYFLVYQYDRHAPNRARARELLERLGASATLLGSRSYISASYKVLIPMQAYTAATETSTQVAGLSPGDRFTIHDELSGNDQTTCWFKIKTPTGAAGWVCGLKDAREYFGTDDIPPRPFESNIRSLREISNASRAFELELRTNHPDNTFQPGEEIVFFVKADRDCFVTLIYFSPQSGGYVLFPNRDQTDMRINAGVEVRIPSEGSPLVFKASKPGLEEISVIATLRPVKIFTDDEVVPGALCAIKAGLQTTARGVDRVLCYFDQALWAATHTAITISE